MLPNNTDMNRPLNHHHVHSVVEEVGRPAPMFARLSDAEMTRQIEQDSQFWIGFDRQGIDSEERFNPSRFHHSATNVPLLLRLISQKVDIANNNKLARMTW
jgi:hypothetical protein